MRYSVRVLPGVYVHGGGRRRSSSGNGARVVVWALIVLGLIRLTASHWLVSLMVLGGLAAVLYLLGRTHTFASANQKEREARKERGQFVACNKAKLEAAKTKMEAEAPGSTYNPRDWVQNTDWSDFWSH